MAIQLSKPGARSTPSQRERGFSNKNGDGTRIVKIPTVKDNNKYISNSCPP